MLFCEDAVRVKVNGIVSMSDRRNDFVPTSLLVCLPPASSPPPFIYPLSHLVQYGKFDGGDDCGSDERGFGGELIPEIWEEIRRLQQRQLSHAFRHHIPRA